VNENDEEGVVQPSNVYELNENGKDDVNIIEDVQRRFKSKGLLFF